MRLRFRIRTGLERAAIEVLILKVRELRVKSFSLGREGLDHIEQEVACDILSRNRGGIGELDVVFGIICSEFRVNHGKTTTFS